MSQQISTVNVLEIADGDLLSIRSFKDNKKGNSEAEALFKNIIKETHGRMLSDEDIESYVEDGYYSSSNGGDCEKDIYELILSHSA